jgi:hypothetical protein
MLSWQGFLPSAREDPASNVRRGIVEAPGKASPVEIFLQCSRYIYNPLSVKSFHGVSAGSMHECSLKLRIGKARKVKHDRRI